MCLNAVALLSTWEVRRQGSLGTDAVAAGRACQAYARSRTDCAELADLVAAGAGAEGEEGVPWAAGTGGKPAKRKRVYEDHRPMSEVAAGLKAGRLHQARARLPG